MEPISRRELIARASVMAGILLCNPSLAIAEVDAQSLQITDDSAEAARRTQSLAGIWRLLMNGPQAGVTQSDLPQLNFQDTIQLPGTTETNQKGQPSDSRQTDSLTFPYSVWGPCWYRTDIDIPAEWLGKRVSLLLERTKYTQVWVDDHMMGENALWCTPQEYDLGTTLDPGQHTLTIMVDNSRLPVNGAADSHMWSGNTQGNWNGIIGKILLMPTDSIWLDDIQVTPDPIARSIGVWVRLGQVLPAAGQATLSFEVNGNGVVPGARKSISFSWESGATAEAAVEISLGQTALLWDEFNPALHTLTATLRGAGSFDQKSVRFGLRSFKAGARQFEINGRTTFLRGKHDACVFPLTGHPPMDVPGWRSYFAIMQDYGLNHVRFHTWTPPDAAFEAADEMGFYLQPELPFWGDFEAGVRRSLEPEAKNILRRLGNHPSFVMFSMGNEPWGGRDVLASLLADLHALDDRRLYVHGTGDGIFVTGDDYNIGGSVRPDWNHPEATVRGANTGTPTSDSHVQFGPPNTMTDYMASTAPMPDPVVSHEMGQYTVYPDFSQIEKYTGVCKPYNLERFRDVLASSGMADMAQAFAGATGALAAICYREEVEACLRTPTHAGFELLDLVDYPGQGSALVGMLDALMDSKGIITPEEWRTFCAPTVLLAKFERYVWKSGEQFTAQVLIANYLSRSVQSSALHATINDSSGTICGSTVVPCTSFAEGRLSPVGDVSISLPNVSRPQRMSLNLSLAGATVETMYPLWIYPAVVSNTAPPGVTIASVFDLSVRNVLNDGGTVVLICDGARPLARSVGGGFANDFWNFRFFHNRPGTMGLLNDPAHPALAMFPTERHSNWQWFDIASKGQPIALDNVLPSSYRPIVQVIDNYERCRKIGLVFEALIGKGKLLVAATDLVALGADHPEAKQLLASLLTYAGSAAFAPQNAVTMDAATDLLRITVDLTGSTASASSTDSGWQGFSATQLIDQNESRGWRADPNAGGNQWCQIQFTAPTDLSGLEILWDEDKPGYRYVVSTSDDGHSWSVLSDQSANDFQTARQDLFGSASQVSYLRVSIVAVPYDRPPMIMEIRIFPSVQ